MDTVPFNFCMSVCDAIRYAHETIEFENAAWNIGFDQIDDRLYYELTICEVNGKWKHGFQYDEEYISIEELARLPEFKNVRLSSITLSNGDDDITHLKPMEMELEKFFNFLASISYDPDLLINKNFVPNEEIAKNLTKMNYEDVDIRAYSSVYDQLIETYVTQSRKNEDRNLRLLSKTWSSESLEKVHKLALLDNVRYVTIRGNGSTPFNNHVFGPILETWFGPEMLERFEGQKIESFFPKGSEVALGQNTFYSTKRYDSRDVDLQMDVVDGTWQFYYRHLFD
ncbi:hypothetical protein QR680_007970 [Steinernema hermaphroditum]|uniref:Uncharacterized protein n=1 Tax=Steinernema hermaphroditum TaxID=289476 RepID=A0AA39IHB1_9BILA|nr:hypothetical protein QR680_007970 [Steinernema hermaphroditum]